MVHTPLSPYTYKVIYNGSILISYTTITNRCYLNLHILLLVDTAFSACRIFPPVVTHTCLPQLSTPYISGRVQQQHQMLLALMRMQQQHHPQVAQLTYIIGRDCVFGLPQISSRGKSYLSSSAVNTILFFCPRATKPPPAVAGTCPRAATTPGTWCEI